MTAKTTTAVIPYAARAFSPSHPDLALEAGVPAQLGNERYVEAPARIVSTGAIRRSTRSAARARGN
jgi:hypothetical protein